MASANDLAIFRNIASDNPSLRWFAIADSAQDPRLPNALRSGTSNVRCLFGGAQDVPLARQSPHLVELRSPTYADEAWSWISQNARSAPCVSIVATCKEFDALFEQFATCAQVELPDSETMFFAFWDPAILGTLVGQADDSTLHLPGPVLTQAQQSLLMNGLARWWYWDRSESLHEISIREISNVSTPNSIKLNQRQVDDLIEASVPDHILYYVTLNQSYLINGINSSKKYELVRGALMHAREIGLASMRDLVEFTCLTLLFREGMRCDAIIVDLLNRVKLNNLSFSEAVNKFPD